ncbi:uracil phosphoribosyltransferase [Cellulophaga sp. F20128]|uniref:DUF6341 family protein n=1 Tax=Cellulophaga sp. F20128 TaxID=2926413 RepID=UPI001FF360FB|nr:uracil phosphoribosyltransferase [Cellulophaga sp. F20128]MCK0158826.1 uracil phosphoribosyltransferase [Cellulophaga sp. F20128]
MKTFFKAIADLFVDVLFAPLDALRALELQSWWAANTLNWIFMIIGAVAMVYWMLQLKEHAANNEEDKSSNAHSFIDI